MRIDKFAMLIHRPNPVRVAVGAQPRIAAVRHTASPSADVRLNRLQVDPRKQRIGIPSNLHVLHANPA